MSTPKKIALLGFDCAITSLVRKHIAEGVCPNFKFVMDNGVVAENCLCPYPTVTPPNWTAMATGAWPGTNNITDFWRHIPGTSSISANTHNSFNWDYVKAESFLESAERAGKKSIVFNYPSSYNLHKKLKNGIVIGGASLTVGVFMDQVVVADIRGEENWQAGLGSAYSVGDDILFSTDNYPGNCVRVSFDNASGWTNVDKMGEEPLNTTVSVPFSGSLYKVKNATWHILVRDLGNGYDTVTLSPTKNFQDAFFTIKTGEWSNAFNAKAPLVDGSEKDMRIKAKLISMNDEAESFRLFVSHGLNTDGENWSFPQKYAELFNKGNNITTNNTGMFDLAMGWFDLDMWMELVEIHYDWLGDSLEALLKSTDWDILYCHAHPTDYIYHVLMTDLDPSTTPSKQAYEKAWQCHQRLFKAADRYLGRLMKLMDEDTLVTLISDHGATPDGPAINTNQILADAGLTVFEDITLPESFVETLPENLREQVIGNFSMKMVEEKCRALSDRNLFVNVNLKGRDPHGIVEPEDYEKTQREICEALMAYVEPSTGKKPFSLALPKKEAALLGLWGEQCGDVVYAFWPEFATQHGNILPTSDYGIGSMKPLCVFYGPKLGIKQGYNMGRFCNLIDLVPTYCYMTGWPIPKDAEGSVIYQIMEDPNKCSCK